MSKLIVAFFSLFLGIGNSVAADFNAVLQKQFEKALRSDLAQRMQVSEEKFGVTVTRTALSPQPSAAVLKSMIKSVELMGLDHATAQRFDGLVSMPIIIHTDMGSFDFRYQAVIAVVGPAYIATRPLIRDEEITADHVKMTQIPWKQLPTGAAAITPQSIIGKRAYKFLSAGAVFYPGVLEIPYAVKSGDVVDLTVLSGPGVMIRSRALAKTSGKIGELIDLQQPISKRMLKAMIVGQKKVEVKLW